MTRSVPQPTTRHVSPMARNPGRKNTSSAGSPRISSVSRRPLRLRGQFCLDRSHSPTSFRCQPVVEFDFAIVKGGPQHGEHRPGVGGGVAAAGASRLSGRPGLAEQPRPVLKVQRVWKTAWPILRKRAIDRIACDSKRDRVAPEKAGSAPAFPLTISRHPLAEGIASMTSSKVSRAPAPPPSLSGFGVRGCGPSKPSRLELLLAAKADFDSLDRAIARYAQFVRRGYKKHLGTTLPWASVAGRAKELHDEITKVLTRLEDETLSSDLAPRIQRFGELNGDWRWVLASSTHATRPMDAAAVHDTPEELPNKAPRGRVQRLAWAAFKNIPEWKDGVPGHLSIREITEKLNEARKPKDTSTIISDDAVRRMLGRRKDA